MTNIAAGILAAGVLVTGLLYAFWPSDTATLHPEVDDALTLAAADSDGTPGGEDGSTDDGDELTAEELDVQYRKTLVGAWEQENLGHRLLTVKDDGTAVMIFRPGGVYSYMLGDKVNFDVAWGIEKGRLDIKVVGGTPESKVKVANTLVGDHWNRPIQLLTDDDLKVRKEEDNSLSEWTRVRDVK